MQVSAETAIDLKASQSWIALHDAIVDAVRLVTPKELCFKLGITAPYLSEALSGKTSKDGKTRGFRLEWLPVLISMAPIDAVAAILRALAELRGFEIERKKTMTPEEKLTRQREALQRLAPGVLALLDKEIGE